MPAFQAFFLVSTLVVFAWAWLKGGHAERHGVLVLMIAFVASVLVQDIGQDVGDGRYRYAVIVVDVILTVVLLRMALTRDRWWLLVATAGQLLQVLAHASLFLNPDLSLRDNIAVRWVFGMLTLYSLLAGVLERKLAGEAAVSGRTGPQTG